MIYFIFQFSNNNHLSYQRYYNFNNRVYYFVLKLDLERPLEDQGPFAVILHKLTEIIARNDEKVCLYLYCIFYIL